MHQKPGVRLRVTDFPSDQIKGVVKGHLVATDEIRNGNGRRPTDSFGAMHKDTFLAGDFSAEDIQDFGGFGEDFGVGFVSDFEVPVDVVGGEVVGTLGGNEVDYPVDFVGTEDVLVSGGETVWLTDRR